MQNKALGCVGIGLVVALIISLVFNMIQVMGSIAESAGGSANTLPPTKFYESLMEEGDGKSRKKIVQLDLDGVISSMGGGGIFGGGVVVDPEGVKRALEEAMDDDDVVAVVVRVNSPGGEVTASDTIYNTVKKFNEKKPVVIYMDSVAASGGYYVACGATEIVAAPTTMTGSIGVIMQTPNATELMEKVGVKYHTFASGQFKDSGSLSREMREDERQYFQDLVDENYSRFVGIVADARGIDEGRLRNEGIADGRIFSGEGAKQAGLVDSVGYVEDAYERARVLGSASGAKVVRYVQPMGLSGLFGLLGKAGEGGATKVEVDMTGGLLPRLEAGKVYLLPPSFVP